MGRVKRLKPKGKLVVRNKTPNAKGEVSISIIFSVNGDIVPRSTGVKVKPEQWDSKAQTVVKHKDARRLNNMLDSIKLGYESVIDKYDGPLTAKILSKLLDGDIDSNHGNPKRIDFIDYALQYAQLRYDTQKIGYSTWYNQKLYLKKLRHYIIEQLGYDGFFPMSEISADLIETYKAYRLKSIGSETMNKELTPILKAIEYAVQNGLLESRMISIVKNSYVETKARSYSDVVDESENTVHYITHEQMMKFLNYYSCAKYPRTREIMDMFLFAFHACGLRVSDIATLEWRHIDFESHTMRKTLVKGKNFHEIQLNLHAMEILERWQKKGLNSRFVFDLLPEDFIFTDKENQTKCEHELKMKISSKNRTIQQSLNKIGIEIGIEGFNLSMHVARHTFAIYALNPPVNLSLHLVSRLLGHSSISVTERNYAIFLPNTINEEIKKSLSFSEYYPR